MARLGGYFLSQLPTDRLEKFPWRLVPFVLIWGVFALVIIAWLLITLFVPFPRTPKPSEKAYRTVDRAGSTTDAESLPCWFDRIAEKLAKRAARLRKYEDKEEEEPEFEKNIEPAEVFMTVVVPAFNEEDRLTGMLEEAVTYLENEYGALSSATFDANGGTVRKRNTIGKANGAAPDEPPRGWEILLIDDGSTDDTILTAQTFSRVHILPKHPRRGSGPWTHHSDTGVSIAPGSIRMVSLEANRGKGGAVTHGMRHARGQYVVFADADGASKFDDLGKLVKACQEIEDDHGRGVAVGSRAHLVGSEAVVKRSKLRNFLMHSFHLLLKFMTPPKTAKIKDTQCGFKLFSRASLPYIVPHMHTEGWIFDVEMLMLAEFAGIPVVEVAIGWREVMGSKLNVIKDSIGMAWGLAILRLCWGVGIYRR